MKRLTTLALSLVLLSGRALAQDATDESKKDPTQRLEEMKRDLELQQQQIKKLEAEAAQRDEELRQMQARVQKQLDDAKAAEARAAQPPSEKAGFVPASLAKSIDATLQQPNPATGVQTPPWAVIKVSDKVNFRFGATLQPTYEALQDPNSEGYSQNFYLRRARFNVLATLPENITVFFQTDDPRVGNSGGTGVKNVNSGFVIQDAYAQWMFLGHAMGIQAGEFLVPQNRQVMTSIATFLSLDLPTWSMQEGTILQWNGGRDYGAGFNGALFNDRLTYRTGVFEGYRAPTTPQEPPLGPAAGGRNSLMFAARVQYDFFDPELGYSYVGTNLGKKKVAAVAGWYQAQNSFKGYGGDAFFDWPVNNGDGITAEMDYMHWDGHGQVFNNNGTLNTLPEQDTLWTNVGYYFANLNLQPFARYEFLHYADAVNTAKEQQRFGVGFNYFVYGQNFKIVPYYERIIPKVQPTTAAIKDLNRFVVEWQGSF